jgi:uncharacterized protein (TIGR02757 family)
MPHAPRPRLLKSALDGLYADFDRSGRIADPIEKVRPFADPADREIVGFLAAGLAFGRVASILASIDAVLDIMGPSPAAFVRRFDPRRDGARFEPFVHRWTRGRDLVGVLLVLRHMLESSGSLEQCFLDGDDPDADDISPGLERFCGRARAVDLRPARAAAAGVHRFFPLPSAGSACKRLNLYLRWMVRRDDIDLGVWTRVSPARLVVPLDVHVVRVCRCLGLTRRVSPGWPMAAEITQALRRFDADDPVRYDFALCHVGMQGWCGFNEPTGDSRCPLRGACRPRPGKPPASRRPSGRR